MRKIKRIALVLALVQLLLLFAACGPEEKPTTEGTTTGAPTTEAPTTQNKVETPTTEKPTTEEITTLPVEDEWERLCLVEDGEAQYVIVNSVSSSGRIIEMVSAFKEEFAELTGATLSMVLDSEPPVDAKEIVFAGTGHREDAAAIWAETAYTEGRIATSEDRIVVASYSEDYMEDMITYLLRAIYEEEGNWYVDADMINLSKNSNTKLKQVHYDTKSGRLQGFGAYYSMEGTVNVTYENTNREEFEAYQEKLVAAGYTKYTENKIGTVEFVTYVNGTQTTHLQFRPDESAVTLNIFRDQYVPAAEPAAYTTLARSSVSYIRRYGFDGWGLSMILQVADGSFIIVDGGKSDATDRNNMIKFMKDHKPAEHEKPIVSLWLMTHPHEDHVEMFAYDAGIFAQHVEVKMLGYNIPIEPCSEVDATGRYWNEYYHHALEAKRAEFFPDAVVWTAHTGQKLYVADAEIEILYTHEDYYPGAIYSANDCNTTYRVTVDGVSYIALGDSDRGNAEMTRMYGSALQADMVQASHHGINGPAEMYQAIDAKIVFWPDCRADITERWNYACNKPWVHQKWTRGEETGDRQHYTSSESTTIYFEDLKK